MSDNRKRYRAIHMKLMQLHNYPGGRAAQRIAVLAGYISGIVASRKTHNREVAKHSGLPAHIDVSFSLPVQFLYQKCVR